MTQKTHGVCSHGQRRLAEPAFRARALPAMDHTVNSTPWGCESMEGSGARPRERTKIKADRSPSTLVRIQGEAPSSFVRSFI